MPIAKLRLCLRALLMMLSVAYAYTGLAADDYIPEDDQLVVERLPHELTSPELVRRSPTDPPNLETAVTSARRMIEVAQRTDDVRFYGYAQAQLTPWWDQDRPPNAVLLVRAIVRQALHDFPAALSDLHRLLKRAPDNAQAWLSRAMIELAQGHPEAATRSCGRLIGKVEDLIGAACFAAAAPSIRTLGLLDQMLEKPSTVAKPVLLWARCVQAEAAQRLGFDPRAADAFREAISLNPSDTGLLSRYSAFLLRNQQAETVIELLQGKANSTALLLRLTQAAHAIGHPNTATYIDRLKKQFATEALRGQTLHLREAARAQLELFDDPHRALQLALENWSSQREISDAHLVLEAATRADRPRAAVPVLQWIRDHRVADVRLAALTSALGAASHASL